MSGLTALTGGSVFWRLGDSQPDYPLVAFPGWALRSPLYVDRQDRLLRPNVFGKLGDDTILSTRGLVFNTQSDDDGEAVITEVLRRLRYVSRQFSLPRTLLATSSHDGASVPTKFEVHTSGRAKIRRHLLATAITTPHIEHVARLGTDFSIPVHADVLLDAIEAHQEDDFRKALLYAAITVEAFASAQLEAAAVANVALGDTSHRVVSFQATANSVVRKDPIASLLLEGGVFSRLLHEAPLYILGRSLLVDRPGTYRSALRLYATRNKLAHLGTQPTDAKYFSPTKEDSAEALAVAIETIEWFGDAGPYVVPDLKFISIRSGIPSSAFDGL